MAKKIFALVAAVVLVVCFAVTVSAVDVNSKTTYVVDGADEKAVVEVSVSGLTGIDNVTYYATKNGTPVYVGQKEVSNDTETFNFTTDYENVDSLVKVGYTGGTAKEDTIPEAGMYTIMYGENEVGKVYEGVTTKTVTFDYDLPAHTTFAGVEATGANVTSADLNEGVVTVVLADIKGDVVLTVKEPLVIEIPGYEPELEIVEAAAIVVPEGFVKDEVAEDEDKDAANANNAGDRKLTVCGKAEAGFVEYGIIVSANEITAGNFWADEFDYETYPAKTAAGIFAIQLIDTSANDSDDAFVKAGEDYYTAVYAKYDSEDGAAYIVKTYAAPVVAE